MTKLGDINITQINLEPGTGGIDALTLEIEFGSPNTTATILIRHSQSMPNTPDNIRYDIVRLGGALLDSALRPQE